MKKPSRLVLALTLVLGVVLVFGQAISFQFLTLDDPACVALNPHVMGGLDAAGLRWALSATTPFYWHPLTWVTFMLDARLYGSNPAGFHLTNVLLHAANGVLVFLLFDRATGARWRSFLVAALFALHPLRADSVAWVAERKDTLSTFFLLAGLLAYVAYAKGPSLGRYALVVLAFVLALLSKPMAVILPVAALLLDAWPLAKLRRATLARCLLEKAPLVALSVVVGLVTVHAQSSVAPPPLQARLAGVVVAYARQLGHVLFPRHLAIVYPRVETPPVVLLGASVLLAGLAVVAVVARHRRPYLTFGLAWFFVLLLPVSGIVAFGRVTAMADRFTYVPVLGLLVAAVWLASDLFDAWGVGLAARAGVATALVLASGGATFVEVSHYRDSRTAFTHAVESTGDNWLAEEQLGTDALGTGDAAAALRHFTRESALYPDNPVALDGTGQALETLGRGAEAVPAYEAALRVAPGDIGVRNNLCVSLRSVGRLDDARACWERAIAIDDAVPLLHHNLAKLDEKTGRTADAVAELERVVRLEPASENALNDLCNALLTARRYDDALTCLERAKTLAPASPFPYLGLARFYDETGRHDLAIIAHRNAESRLPPAP
jgi:Flp pilus assembly protein TadD